MAVDRRELTAPRKVAALAATILGVAGALLLLDPGAIGLGAVPGFLHLLSFRMLTGFGLLVAAAAVAATCWWRTGTPVLRLVLAAALLLSGLWNVGTVVLRGWSGPVADRADLVVLALNTQGGATTAAEVARALADQDVTVAGLPETMPSEARAIAREAADLGLDYQLFLGRDGTGLAQTTALLIRSDLGAYQQVSAPYVVLGAARAVPVSGSGPTFAAIHSVTPLTDRGAAAWDRYAGIAADLCREAEDTVVIGDFNTTLDHPALRDLGHCADAAAETGRGGEGTWPAHFPAPLATPIDHVLFDTRTLTAVGSWTERIGGTDHRAVFVQLDGINPTEAT